MDDFYSQQDIEDYFDEDEINASEFGFMMGYLGMT